VTQFWLTRALALGFLLGCSHSQQSRSKCDDLASVAGVSITRAEVDLLVGEAAAAGSQLSLPTAFRDLLWQEAERQRLGLPGGKDITSSRAEAVRRYRRTRMSREPIDLHHELPASAVLTACGTAILSAKSPDAR
jgi:hypothetical protein